MVLKVDRWNRWIFGLSSVKMERKDRLYWRHPKTKSPDETNRPNIDWIIKAQYASQLTTYFIERKHIQRKGLSPRKHIQMKWLSQLRFLWHLELQVLSSFLHLQAFVLHLDLQVNLNTPVEPTQPPPYKRTQKDPSVQQSHQQGGNWWCLSDTFHFSHWNELSKLPS